MKTYQFIFACSNCGERIIRDVPWGKTADGFLYDHLQASAIPIVCPHCGCQSWSCVGVPDKAEFGGYDAKIIKEEINDRQAHREPSDDALNEVLARIYRTASERNNAIRARFRSCYDENTRAKQNPAKKKIGGK